MDRFLACRLGIGRRAIMGRFSREMIIVRWEGVWCWVGSYVGWGYRGWGWWSVWGWGSWTWMGARIYNSDGHRALYLWPHPYGQYFFEQPLASDDEQGRRAAPLIGVSHERLTDKWTVSAALCERNVQMRLHQQRHTMAATTATSMPLTKNTPSSNPSVTEPRAWRQQCNALSSLMNCRVEALLEASSGRGTLPRGEKRGGRLFNLNIKYAPRAINSTGSSQTPVSPVLISNSVIIKDWVETASFT